MLQTENSTPVPRHQTDRGRIYEAKAEDVYPLLQPGSVQLVILDGPYALKKASWDSMDVSDLPEWYRPHIEALGVACAADASTYVWGTDDSASILRPEMKAHGWTLQVRITWDKVFGPHLMSAGGFPDITEVCDVYHRGAPPWAQLPSGAINQRGRQSVLTNVWRKSIADPAMRRERLQLPSPSATGEDSLYKSSALHPCQKPLIFAERMIRASSEPGALVLSVFSGTCREAVVCEGFSPSEARQYICIEKNEDGPDYLGPAIEELEAARRQGHLF